MDDQAERLQETRRESLEIAIQSLTDHVTMAHTAFHAHPERRRGVGSLYALTHMLNGLFGIASLFVLAVAWQTGIGAWLVAYAAVGIYLSFRHIKLHDGIRGVVMGTGVWPTSETIDSWQIWVADIAGKPGIPTWAADAASDEARD